MLKEYSIDSEIYTEDIIQQGIIDFKDVTTISLNEGLLTINGESEEEIEEIFLEFSNYLISLINE